MKTLPGRRSAVIHIFLADGLPDGLPDGLREVEKLGWTGHALVCPRSRFPEAKAQDEFDRTGVYVLLGPSEEGDLPAVYIGEGDPTRYRLEQHYREKDFWTSLIVFTSKDKNLNKAHVQYLESRLVTRPAAPSDRCWTTATSPNYRRWRGRTRRRWKRFSRKCCSSILFSA